MRVHALKSRSIQWHAYLKRCPKSIFVYHFLFFASWKWASSIVNIRRHRRKFNENTKKPQASLVSLRLLVVVRSVVLLPDKYFIFLDSTFQVLVGLYKCEWCFRLHFNIWWRIEGLFSSSSSPLYTLNCLGFIASYFNCQVCGCRF